MTALFSRAGRMRVQDGFYFADNAVLVGDLALGKDANVWFHSVLRGDDAPIRIGARTNIQDLTMIHPEPGDPVTIGDDVTVGHRALLHGRKIGDRCLIGMGAILLGWSEIGEESIVGAGALVLERTIVPPRSLLLGAPAKIVRRVTDEEVEEIRRSAAGYVRKVEQYLS